MKYRREIDGLRAVAVLPVILFHAGFTVFSGGYVGVDVFFVISGFLITTILLGELEAGDYSIARFYERRARRILPALFLVLACASVAAWAIMLPSQLDEFGRSLISVVLFVSNVFFWKESDYFAPAAELSPLLHTWSLAVEEQFYIVFPIMLALVWRFGRRSAFWLVAAMSVASLLMAQWASVAKPTANFFLIPTRAWELGAGSICAFLLHGRAPRPSAALSTLGLALVAVPIFVYDATTPFPSVWALAPVGGTALIILFGAAGTPVGRLLSTAPFVGIGLISYSAYLWHQPLFAFARLSSTVAPSLQVMGGLALLTLVLAWASWRFVEQPFRRGPASLLPTRAQIFGASALAGVALAMVGGYNVATDGRLEAWKAAHPDRAATYALIEAAGKISNRYLDDGGCRFNVQGMDATAAERAIACAKANGPGVAVIGDSHGIDFFNGMDMAYSGRFLMGITSPGCRPAEPKPGYVAECPYDAFATFVAANPQVFSDVIFTQSGSHLMTDGSESADDLLDEIPETAPAPANLKIERGEIERALGYLDRLAAAGPQVIWLGPRLEPRIGLNFILRGGCAYPYALREGQAAMFGKVDAEIAAAARQADATPGRVAYVSQIDALGFDMGQDFMTCDRVYWRDGDHWSAEGAKRFVGRLLAGPRPAIAQALHG